MRATLVVGGFLAKVPRLTPARVVALLAAMLGAVVALGLAASAASAETFSNNTLITINTATVPVPCPETLTTPATPYPSGIEVSGLIGKVSDVNVTLTGLSHTFPDDVGVLLVGPEGQSTILMTDSGGASAVSGLNLTFDDAAPEGVPDGSPLLSGTFKPHVGTLFSSCAFPGTFPAPAPVGPYGTTLSVFNGTNPNGTWQLFVIDDTRADSGSISGGWSLTINTDATAPSVTINQASGQADPTTDSPIHFTAVFSEPVTDFTDSDVTLSGTAGATTADVTEIAPNDGTTYDVAVSGMTTDGTVIATIPANAAKDIALNGNTTSTSTDNTVTFIANRPPTAVADSYSTNKDNPLTVAAPGVLANDTDQDGDTLSAVQVSGPAHGTLSLNANGSFSYTPNVNFIGSDSFTYKANDGSADSNVATVSINVRAPTTKADCKNGGWSAFGYPDQGTCISDVNRRNRP